MKLKISKQKKGKGKFENIEGINDEPMKHPVDQSSSRVRTRQAVTPNPIRMSPEKIKTRGGKKKNRCQRHNL